MTDAHDRVAFCQVVERQLLEARNDLAILLVNAVRAKRAHFLPLFLQALQPGNQSLCV